MERGFVPLKKKLKVKKKVLDLFGDFVCKYCKGIFKRESEFQRVCSVCKVRK